MRLFKRSDNAHYDGGGLDKYFVKCKDPNNTDSWLQNPFSMDVNNERAIVSALIHDGYARHNQKVVIKVGKSELIRKEYQIGERLKNVPGFIRYICAMQCHDDLEKYKKNAAFSICSKETHNDLMNVLIMPFMSLGSVRKYSWEEHPIEQFQSCLKQIVLSLYVAFEKDGFIHNDIHLDNVLLSRTRKSTISYEMLDGSVVTVPCAGIRIHIMDLENAFMPVDRRETKTLFRDLDHVVNDLKYAARLMSPDLAELNRFAFERSWSNTPLSDALQMLPMIDKMTSVQREKPPNIIG